MISSTDTLWLVVATFMVLLMQVGFLMLEGGRVRSKNSVNVAQKNASDLAVSWICFMCFGFFLMFGIGAPLTEAKQLIGRTPSPMEFLYQLAFCATAASIVSGAVAERITFKAYLILTMVISGFIYPMVGRLVWGNMFHPDTTAWMADLGFIDFAGATVVHGVGAAAGLVGALMLGPRAGRFDSNGKPQPLPAHNSVIALMGVLVLLFCWLGFNGGSISPSDPLLQRVLLNTLTAAAFGSIVGLFIGAYFDQGKFNPSRVCNGMIGGLVACTAAVNIMSTVEAIIIGSIGGALATWSGEVLLHKAKLDDPVDVVATHGVAGLFGTVAVAFVGPLSALPTGNRFHQAIVQFGSALLLLSFVAVVTFCTLSLIRRYSTLRVSANDERLGLNYTEHGESIGSGRLQLALESQIQGTSGFGDRFDVASNDENSELASAMNQLLDKHEAARKQIRLSEKRFQHFAQTASDWLWETDDKLRFVTINANSIEKENEPDRLIESAIGQHFFELLEVKEQDKRQISQCLETHSATEVFEARVGTEEDSNYILVEVRGVPYFSLSGQFQGYRGTISDITPRKAAENRAIFLSLHDELTGLPNRRALSNQLGNMLTAAEQNGFTAVVAGVDLDGFKSVNDSYGHAAGDTLLKQVAERLESCRRSEDLVYRTGGDEFVIVLTGLEPQSAQSNAESICTRVIEQLSREYIIDTHRVTIGASIGIALYPEHSDGSDNLARLADLALYAAKSQGKARVVTFEPQMDTDAQYRRKLEDDLRSAIDEKQFHLVYQPLMDTGNEQLAGFEALIRWSHPERGEIPPDSFIDVAEQLHLMEEIGEFVLLEACTFASNWQCDHTQTLPIIAVNVSPDQLRGTEFPDLVKSVLDKTGLDPARLELEITENVLIDDFDKVNGVLHELTTLGVSISVDDFGSGQTSLRYLNNFPFSKLKIDRSFIRHLCADDKAAEITRSIVNLGRRLGVLVLAEGVEEENQLNILKTWDCDQVQGFLFSKPVSPDRVTEMLNQNTSVIKKAVGE